MNKKKVFCEDCIYYRKSGEIRCCYIVTKTKTDNPYKIEIINTYANSSFDNKDNKCKYYEGFTIIPFFIFIVLLIIILIILFRVI